MVVVVLLRGRERTVVLAGELSDLVVGAFNEGILLGEAIVVVVVGLIGGAVAAAVVADADAVIGLGGIA